MSLRIVCISDTHELHRELVVPPGDVLIHAGDFTFFGRGTRAIRDFDEWLGELPHRSKIITCGNHEFAIEADPGLRNLITNGILLLNQSAMIGPAKVWASPLTMHNGGAFCQNNAADRAKVYSSIPADTDILVTHGPPEDILDRSDEYPGPGGDRELRQAVLRVKPRLHVFGHVHAAYGVLATKHTLFANASLLGVDGSLTNHPIVLEMSEFKNHNSPDEG